MAPRTPWRGTWHPGWPGNSAQVIVENKPGASGQLGTSFVKAAPADRSTYLLALDHSVVVVPLITPTAGYDAMKDFVAAGQVARFQWTLPRSWATLA